MVTICKKCQNLFSGKNKENIINVSFAELAQRIIKVNAFLRELCFVILIECPSSKKKAFLLIINFNTTYRVKENGYTSKENKPDLEIFAFIPTGIYS